MHFTVKKSDFLSAIQQVSKVTSSRSTIAILNNILFDLNGDTLALRSSDIEITMCTKLTVSGKMDGCYALPMRMILDIINEIEEETVEFKASPDGLIKIFAGKGVYDIMSRPGEEFPSIPKIKEIKHLLINNKTLNRLISKSIIAVSRDEMKPSLMGVLFEIHNEGTRAVATDGHRLVCIKRSDFISEDFTGTVIIPTKFLNLLLGYLGGDGVTSLIIGENHVKVTCDTMEIYSRIIDERFPDYESVIPKDNNNILLLSISSCLSVLRRISLFSNRTTKQITIDLKQSVAKLSTRNQEAMTSADEEMNIDYKGNEMTIGFNADYLRDILKIVDTDSACIKINTPTTACVVEPEEQELNEELIMLLMPIRIND